MIIVKSIPFTRDEVKKASKLFGVYIKTVIDVEKKICVAGMDRHFEGEKILLDSGSEQSDIWGGGIDIATKVIDCNSFINIRPKDDNNSNEILDRKIREKYEKLSKYFFSEIL